MIKFFTQAIYKYKFRIFILGVYSVFCGYAASIWPLYIQNAANNDLKSQIMLITIAAIITSSDYLKELLIYPFFSFCTYQLKHMAIIQAHTNSINNVESGQILIRFQRAFGIRLISKFAINAFTSLATIISTLLLILKANIDLGFFSIFFLLIATSMIFNIQQYYAKLKLIAWKESEIAGVSSAQSLDQTVSMRQNFGKINYFDESLKKELKVWNNYYFKSNIIFLLLSLSCVILLVFGLFVSTSVTLIFLIWNLVKHIASMIRDVKATYSMIIDLQIFFEKNEIKKNNIKILSKDVILQNIIIPLQDKEIGPFSIELKAQVTGICGNNGVGKTKLGLAIANLIPYQGTICSPNALYVSSETKIIMPTKKMSRGQEAIITIKEALLHPAQLIIIDELLDSISSANMKQVWKQIYASDKKIIIISHKKELLIECEEIYEILNNYNIQKRILR